MGLDLTLFPLHASYRTHDGKLDGYAHTKLDVRRMRGLFDAISSSGMEKDIPEGSEIYTHIGETIKNGDSEGERTYGNMCAETNPYGDPHTYMPAVSLLGLFQRFLPGDPVTAYLAALPGDSIVVLYWH